MTDLRGDNMELENKNNECNHEWKRGQTSIIDPDGWYYNQPCYSVEYICAKCGEKKHVLI